MNLITTPLPAVGSISPRVESFRLPAPGKRDPHFGLSRGWYYKAAELGEIRMIAVRQRGALRGVRLVVYDSVANYIRRAGQMTKEAPVVTKANATQTSLAFGNE